MRLVRRDSSAGVPLRIAMGGSESVALVIEQVEQVGASRFAVLIQGETGTGKELVARALHDQAQWAEAPFLAVDCGAIPDSLVQAELFGYERGAFTGAETRRDGLFMLANGGTLFLDEVGNLSLATQAALLRVLEEREIRPLGSSKATSIDVWVIAATNVDLASAVEAGRFREDLYYRLSECVIALPALRERSEDVPHLAQRFLVEATAQLHRPLHDISDAAMELLRRHRWPGNVRELRNVIRQATLRSTGTILPEHLRLDSASADRPARVADTSAMSLRELAHLAVADVERQAIRDALRACGGNKSQAARLLRTDYKTLHTKMRVYRIAGREVPTA